MFRGPPSGSPLLVEGPLSLLTSSTETVWPLPPSIWQAIVPLSRSSSSPWRHLMCERVRWHLIDAHLSNTLASQMDWGVGHMARPWWPQCRRQKGLQQEMGVRRVPPDFKYIIIPPSHASLVKPFCHQILSTATFFDAVKRSRRLIRHEKFSRPQHCPGRRKETWKQWKIHEKIRHDKFSRPQHCPSSRKKRKRRQKQNQDYLESNCKLCGNIVTQKNM